MSIAWACSFVALAFPAFATNTVFFDVQGAVETHPLFINQNGDVTGYYSLPDSSIHAFVRTNDGVISTFDPQGSTETRVAGINKQGVTAGWWTDQSSVKHGFVRSSDGMITTFDVIGSSFTDVGAINDSGAVAGRWQSPYAPQPIVGYIRASDGTITNAFGPTGDVQSVGGMNANGVVAGQGFNRNSSISMYIFFLSKNDTLELNFSADAGSVAGINASDQIAGTKVVSLAPGGETITGFLWESFAMVRHFSAGAFTYVYGLNNAGAIVGSVGTHTNSNPGAHAFIRTSDGQITLFDVGVSSSIATGINDNGVITGAADTHGFIMFR